MGECLIRSPGVIAVDKFRKSAVRLALNGFSCHLCTLSSVESAAAVCFIHNRHSFKRFDVAEICRLKIKTSFLFDDLSSADVADLIEI